MELLKIFRNQDTREQTVQYADWTKAEGPGLQIVSRHPVIITDTEKSGQLKLTYMLWVFYTKETVPSD